MPQLPLRRALLALVLLPPTLALAQRDARLTQGDWPSRAELLLAHAADANGDSVVDAAEWQALVQRFTAADGSIDRERVRSTLLSRQLDRDDDGVLTRADLDAMFRARDTDGDGVLSAEEQAARRGRVGGPIDGIVLGFADADQDGVVTAAEWQTLREALPAEGAVPQATMSQWMAAAEEPTDTGRTGITPGVWLITVTAQIDADKDGVCTSADLEALRAKLDADGDGTLQANELAAATAPPRTGDRRRRRGAGGGGGELRRDAPCLVPWQRSLDDALAVVQRTGKPLLVCVNMDGEAASEQLAWGRYRDPEFVALMNGFVPVLASPDRHGTRERDDRGRRLEDPRFGRLLCSEHVDIEPSLFERYFHGNRVAPRHVAVAPDGKILFDVFLVNDLSLIEDKLREHGKRDTAAAAGAAAAAAAPAAATPAAVAGDPLAQLDDPDATVRARVERAFVDGDEDLRAKLARAALSAERRTQHPELLHLALRDPSPRVRQAGVDAIVDHPRQVPIELFPAAFASCRGDVARRTALVEAIRKVPADGDGAAAKRVRHLQRALAALVVDSRLLDPAAWAAACAAAPATAAPAAPSEEEIEALDRQLDELDRRRRAAPEDRTLALQAAAANLRYAQIRIAAGRDPSFLLEDVRRLAQQATSVEAPDGRALAHIAWADELLGDSDHATEAAAAAVPHLLAEAPSALAAQALDLLARGRTRALYAAISADRDWAPHLLADARAAYEALLAHPLCTEAQAIAYTDLLGTADAFAEQRAAVQRAIARFPLSSELHARLRAQVLVDEGADALEAAYRELPTTAATAPGITWFAGLATLVAAEHRVQNHEVDGALAGYQRAVERFARAIEGNPGYESSAKHYMVLAHAGAARLHADAGRLEAAAASLREALAAVPASPASATTQDGLGRTPAQTLGFVLAALRRAGHGEAADALGAAAAEAGVRAAAPAEAASERR